MNEPEETSIDEMLADKIRGLCTTTPGVLPRAGRECLKCIHDGIEFEASREFPSIQGGTPMYTIVFSGTTPKEQIDMVVLKFDQLFGKRKRVKLEKDSASTFRWREAA